MSVAQNGSIAKRKSDWKSLQLTYKPTIRHYRRRLVESSPKVNIDFHKLKTSADQSISVQRQGASARIVSDPDKKLGDIMDPGSRYKVSSASLKYNKRPMMEEWRVLDKTSLIPTQVSLVDMMDRSGEHSPSFFLKNLAIEFRKFSHLPLNSDFFWQNILKMQSKVNIFGSDRSSGCHSVRLSVRLSVRHKFV